MSNTQNSSKSPDPKKVQKTQSFWRRLYFFSKITVLLFVTLPLFAFSTVYIASLIIPGDTLKRLTVSAVKSHPQLDLEIASLSYDLLQGLVLEGIQIKHSLPHSTLSLETPRIVVKYDLLAVLRGQIRIREAKVINPIIEFEQLSESPNQPIRTDTTEQPLPPKQNESFRIPIHPNRLLLMPFNLLVEEIGFTSLTVRNKTPSSELTLKNIDMSINSKWHGARSQFTVGLFSSLSESSNISFTRSTNKDQPLSFTCSFYFSTQLIVTDLDNINTRNIFSNSKCESMSITLPKPPPILLSNEIDVSLSQDLTGITINNLDFHIDNAVSFALKGSVTPRDTSFAEYHLNLSLLSDLNIKNAASLIPPQFSNMIKNPQGTVSFDFPTIRGTLNPNKIAELAPNSLPTIDGNIEIKDLHFHLPGEGISLNNLASKTSISLAQTKEKSGLNLNFRNRLKAQNFKALLRNQKELDHIGFSDLSTVFSLQSQYPSLHTPYIRASVGISEIYAATNTNKNLKFPMDLEINANAPNGFDIINFDLKATVGEYLRSFVDLRCRDKCKDIDLFHKITLASLENLQPIYKPILQKKIPLELIPDIQSINITTSGDSHFRLSDFTKIDPDKIAGDYDINFQVSNFNMRLPLHNLSFTDFSNMVSLKGTTKKAKLLIDTKWRSLRADLTDPIKSIAIDRFTNSLRIEADRKHDKHRIPLQAAINNELHINLIKTPSSPIPITNLSSQILAQIDPDLAIKVKTFETKLPELGFLSQIAANFDISSTNNIDNLILNTLFSVSNQDSKSPLSGVETQGSAAVKTRIASTDLKLFKIVSDISFSDFSFSSTKSPLIPLPTIGLSELNGNIAIDHSFSLRGPIKNKEGSNSLTKNASKKDNLLLKSDFLSLRPSFPRNRSLSIKTAKFDRFEAKNIEIDLQMKDNNLALKNFSLDFLNGTIQGDINLSITSTLESLAFNLHTIGINTNSLMDALPEDQKPDAGFSLLSDPIIDASTHIFFENSTNQIDGGIDISRIGKDQLRFILHFIDPDNTDPSLNTIRTALLLGDISMVSIPIKNGLIGLDVDITALAVPIPLPTIEDFPISDLIANLTKKEDGTDIDESNL